MAKPRRRARTRTCEASNFSLLFVSFWISTKISSISFAESLAVGGASTKSGWGMETSTNSPLPSSPKPSRASSSNCLAFFSFNLSEASCCFSLTSAFARSSSAQFGYLACSAASSSATKALKSLRHWNESRWKASAGNSNLERICVATSSIENVVWAASVTRRCSGTKLPKILSSTRAASARAKSTRRAFSSSPYRFAWSSVMRARAEAAALALAVFAVAFSYVLAIAALPPSARFLSSARRASSSAPVTRANHSFGSKSATSYSFAKAVYSAEASAGVSASETSCWPSSLSDVRAAQGCSLSSFCLGSSTRFCTLMKRPLCSTKTTSSSSEGSQSRRTACHHALSFSALPTVADSANVGHDTDRINRCRAAPSSPSRAWTSSKTA
mmetsp:Transcript_13859/g.41919  ORF Transcript_13859/g.41919 Transcript_13859/m.41919 type:complete len:386 (-) Transcript_13859:1314-2471(-)